jgi:hypothetical protein
MTREEALKLVGQHWMKQDYTVRDRNSEHEIVLCALEALGLIKFDAENGRKE